MGNKRSKQKQVRQIALCLLGTPNFRTCLVLFEKRAKATELESQIAIINLYLDRCIVCNWLPQLFALFSQIGVAIT